MRSDSEMVRPRAGAAALALFAGAAACGVEALRVHLWTASLGPICGLDRPALFFLHCPACPIGLSLLALGGAFAVAAARKPVRARR